MKFVSKYKFVLMLFGLLSILYFASRLPNLTSQPIFVDEAIYIRWSQIMRAEPTLRFLPLSDGKTPLFMWILMPLFKIFDDPLFAGRFLSIISGFGTLAGVFFLGWKFFNSKAALWSVALLIFTPLIFFFDRMALVDCMLATFSIWSLNLALLLIKYQRLDLAMFLGYALGGSLLTKTPGMFNILALPVTLITFNWLEKFRQWKLLKIFGLWMVAFIITFGLYSILKLGPGFNNLSSRNQDYVFSPMELIGRPLDPFIPHFHDLQDWFPKLITWPIMIFVFLGIVFSFLRKNKYALAILFWALVPLIIEMFLLKTFTARYILSSIPPLLFLGGWAISEVSQKIKFKSWLLWPIFATVLLAMPVQTDWLLLTNLEQAPLPRSERNGYLEAWTAGYGFPEIAKYLIEQSKKGTIVVGTEGSFGTLPDGLMIYLDEHSHNAPKDKQILVIGGNATVSANLRKAALTYPTYYVANKSRFDGADNIELINEYSKPKGPRFPQDAILFYRVFP